MFNLFIPTKLLFGCGAVEKLAGEELPGKKALVVISAGTSMKKFGYLDKVIAALNKGGAQTVVFDKVLPNPIKAHVMEAAAICRNEGCDFVVGLGGGSSIDTAKSVAVMACNDGDYWDYVSGGSGKGQPVDKALPIIAVPTTAGTGTEMDPWTVVTHETAEEKIGYGCRHTFPVISVVDPELMLSVPAHLTAYQGFDAFFHASEGFIANIASPISDMYALEAIRLIYKYLPVAVADGSNLEARTKVAWASTLAGMVESTSSCVSEHSLEHAMSAYYPALPHGAGLIAISKAYFTTFKADCEERFKRMAEAMTGSKADSADSFIEALAAMQEACGVSDIKLSSYGIKADDFTRFLTNARSAMGGLFTLDPRPITDDEVINIYSTSYK